MKGQVTGTLSLHVDGGVTRLYNVIDPEQDGIEVVTRPNSKFR